MSFPWPCPVPKTLSTAAISSYESKIRFIQKMYHYRIQTFKVQTSFKCLNNIAHTPNNNLDIILNKRPMASSIIADGIQTNNLKCSVLLSFQHSLKVTSRWVLYLPFLWAHMPDRYFPYLHGTCRCYRFSVYSRKGNLPTVEKTVQVLNNSRHDDMHVPQYPCKSLKNETHVVFSFKL